MIKTSSKPSTENRRSLSSQDGGDNNSSVTYVWPRRLARAKMPRLSGNFPVGYRVTLSQRPPNKSAPR